jgi:hypothetical protein
MFGEWVPLEIKVNEFSPFRYKLAALVLAYAQFLAFIALITLVVKLVWNA